MNNPPDNETPEDTPELRRRIGATLAQRLWLRFHVGVLVGTTIVVGFIVSVTLQHYAPFRTALGPRYAIATVVAYAWFLLGVRWWVKYFAGIRPPIGNENEDRGRFDVRTLHDGNPLERHPFKISDGGDGCLDPGCFDVEGLIVAAVFIALLWGVVSVYSSGPIILTEAATDALLAGGLLKWARRTERAWMEKSIGGTLPQFAAITTSLFILGLWAHYHCPSATRIGEVWSCP